MKNTPKNKMSIKKGTAKRLLGYLTSKYKVTFALVLLCIIITSAASVASAGFLRIVIDDHITPMLTQANPSFLGLVKSMTIMACVYAVGIICSYLYSRLMVSISQGVMKKIRDDLFSHMQTLPIKYFDTHPFGDTMSHYTNDIDTLETMLSQSIPQGFASIITLLSVTVMMFILSIPLTIMVFICVFFMILIIKTITKNSSKYFIKQQATVGDLNGYIEEMINGQKVVKVFCHEEATKADFDTRNEELCKNSTKANMYSNITMPIMGNIGNVQYVLIALIGGVMAISGFGGITLGAIASFLTLSKSFSQPIGQISMQMNSIIMALAGASRIFTMMDEESEEDNGYVTLVNAKKVDGELQECKEHTGIWAWRHPHSDNSLTYTEVQGLVEMFDVDFGYTEEKTVLHNISLYAKSGQKIAFVGATGAGKTTITNLINRFYDIADGKIRFDGININKIKKPDLRRALGVVLQDTNLFTGTVMENIRFGKLTANDDEIIAAAKLANAHDFISRLPEGYNTVIDGDGGSLSQGQRQLISIARAAVADPPVMILDEATSSIDTRTEALVQKGMDGLMNGRTVFVIAHRLSTIQNAHAIMVMEQGKIIERGSHDQLIEQCGRYYQLYTGNFAENS